MIPSAGITINYNRGGYANGVIHALLTPGIRAPCGRGFGIKRAGLDHGVMRPYPGGKTYRHGWEMGRKETY